MTPLWEHKTMGVFQRFHAGYVGRTGVPVGVFVAVDHLRRTGRLSEEEIVLYAVIETLRPDSDLRPEAATCAGPGRGDGGEW